MNIKILAAICAIATLITAGCVRNVSGGRTAGVPFVKDKIEGKYQRSVDQVFEAAKAALVDFGSLSNETILHGETNLVKTLVGRVDTRTVYVRVEPVDAQITSVRVQTRIPGGGSDIDLAHQIEKQIALKLVE